MPMSTGAKFVSRNSLSNLISDTSPGSAAAVTCTLEQCIPNACRLIMKCAIWLMKYTWIRDLYLKIVDTTGQKCTKSVTRS